MGFFYFFFSSSVLGVQTLSYPSSRSKKWKWLTELCEQKLMFLPSFLSLAVSSTAIFYTEMTPTGYSYKHFFFIVFEASAVSFFRVSTHTKIQKTWRAGIAAGKNTCLLTLVLVFNVLGVSELRNAWWRSLCGICHWSPLFLKLETEQSLLNQCLLMKSVADSGFSSLSF